MARHTNGDGEQRDDAEGSFGRLNRLHAARARSEQIASLVPGAAAHPPKRLPTPLAELLGRCGCGLLLSVVKACLLRLVAEATIPTSKGGAPMPDRPHRPHRSPRGNRHRG
jgi:hypothetical protein